jgi:hypothetical protein
MLNAAFGMLAMAPAVFGMAGYTMVSRPMTVSESISSTVDFDARASTAADEIKHSAALEAQLKKYAAARV